MSVQVVTAKMAEVEVKDEPNKELPAGSPVTPSSDDKTLAKNVPHDVGSSATTPTIEPSVKADPSPGLLTPNPVKMPQSSAMKRPEPQQNGGDAFVNRDGTVAEAPRMKKRQTRLTPSNGASLGCLHEIQALG
ncbi:unnamed protein product [Arctogadus glacialis]